MTAKSDVQALRAELRAQGVFDHHELQGWLKLVGTLAMSAACLTGVVMLPWFLAVPLVPLAAVFMSTAAMLGHEGSHRSFSPSSWRNSILQHVAFPLLTGLGAQYWKHKHDELHHGHPNVEGLDPDIRPWPMVTSREAHRASSRPIRWFHRNLQAVAFWPLTTLLAVGMRASSILHLVNLVRRRPGAGLRWRPWLADAGCLLAHYTLWLVIPSIVWGPLVPFILYTALWGSVGVVLALIFAPAHLGLPIVVGQNRDWRHQLETTRNLITPRWLSWFFVGLDYQIEHHLFPKIPHQNLPRAATMVAAWCARVDLPHRSITYGAALTSVTRFMATAWDLPASDGNALRAATSGDATHLAA